MVRRLYLYEVVPTDETDIEVVVTKHKRLAEAWVREGKMVYIFCKGDRVRLEVK